MVGKAESKVFWDKCRQQYISGKMSLHDVAKTNGVGYSTVHKHAKAEHWDEMRDKVEKNIDQTAIDRATETRVNNLKLLGNAISKLILKAERAAEACDESNTRGLLQIANTVKVLQSTLGSSPERDEREQEARIKAIESQIDSKIPEDITIRIENADDYAD